MCVKSEGFKGLPVDVLPYHYNITLKLDLKAFTSVGEQDIYIDVSILFINLNVTCSEERLFL